MKRKILAAFLLAFVAIALALTITHFSFREMMGTVDELSAPNEKLTRLNKVFEEIITLDQQQRAEAIQNPEKPYKYFLDQTGYLQMMIDSLLTLPWDDVQKKRLKSLGGILDKRNEHFVSYLKVKAELANNKEFSQQLDTLSILLKQSQNSDSSIITTSTTTITRYLQDSVKAEKPDKGFLKKLFNKKKKTAEQNPVAVQEEQVKVDTVSIPKQGIDLAEVNKIMKGLEYDQRSQRTKLQRKELELIFANTQFINQLVRTLHEVQNEELQIMRSSNKQASTVVTRGINRINILMLTFFLGAAVLVYFIFIDISRSNYYKKQLERARDQAEELSKIKQRFLANMSHEIRTPLQSIIGFAEQLKHGHHTKESVDAIHSSSEHLLQIVNEVLDYSRISSGNFTLATEKFNLLRLVKEVESAIRIQAERKNLTFILDTEKASDQHLMGDPFRLRQILYNLLGNAIKFTYRGYVRLTVKTVDEQEENTRVVFEVSDTGIGMDANEVNKIFNQFEQANHEISRTYGGTGLGLTIVKALVEVQKGEMEVKSEQGVGSTFRVALRFAKALQPVEKTKAPSLTSVQEFKSKVLVVDDDAMILKLCSLILKNNNINHQVYRNAETLLHENPDPSVSHVLIDIRMPQINGVQLCKALKEKYPSKTKFIALTAHVLADEQKNLLQDGFDQVLTKPFHESALIQALGVTVQPQKSDKSLPDFGIVRQMTMGDESLFQSVMQQFIEESDSDYQKLQETFSVGNQKLVREIVHKLAGRFGQVGVYELSAKLHAIEVNLVEGKSTDELKVPLNDVIREGKDLLQRIRLTTITHVN